MSSLRQRLGFVPAATGDGQPEWSGLVARLSAAHAARRALESQGHGLARGDFTLWPAREKADPQRPVNPTDLMDGKAPQAMIRQHAGSALAGS